MRKYNFDRFCLAIVTLCSLFSMTFAPLASQAYAQDAGLQARLQQYIKDRKINTKAVETTLKVRCSVAQAKLRNLQTRVATAQSTRAKAYKDITDTLTTLQTNLNAQAFETTSFKAVIDTYNGKVTDFTDNLNNYKQALDDAIAVDCVKDPYGFRGALETARLYHDRLAPAVTDIRSYATNTVKSTLDQIKTKLANGDTTGSTQ